MKKIIALAVASAFIVPAAMAEVTIYGSARTAVEYSSIDTTAGNIDRVRLIDESSRLGFKGTDKLDSGLTVLWQAEQRIRIGSSNLDGTSNASAGWGDRDTYVGLQGDFGLIRAGKFDDIIDASKGDFFIGVDNMEETSAGVTKFVRRGAGKPNNVVAYHSPLFSGFGFKAQYDFGSKDTTKNANAYGYAATAFYKHSMFDFGLGYKQNYDTLSNVANADKVTADGDKYKYFEVGANIKPIAGLNVGLSWDRQETESTTTAANNVKQDGYAIGATYEMGKFKYGLSYGALNDRKVNSAKIDDSSSWGVNAGLQYALSKQTKLLAGATYVSNDSKSATSSGTVDLSKVTSPSPLGANVTAVSVGIRTDF